MKQRRSTFGIKAPKRDIALKVGISRTSIYRFERYKAARSLLKEGRRQFLEWQQT